MSGRGQRPPRQPYSQDEINELERQNDALRGQPKRADNQGDFWKKDITDAKNAMESARSMLREVEDGGAYGDSDQEMKANSKIGHQHLDRAEEKLNSARDSETKRQGKHKRRGLFG